MKKIKILIEKITKDKLFYFVYLPFVASIFIIGFLLLVNPEASCSGVRDGLGICLDTLIPSLFPFLFVAHLLVETEALNINSRFISKITEVFFSLPGSAFPIIVLSFIGGFPVGASLVKSAYERKIINESQGRRLLLFCTNPGPSFCLSAVGCVLYNSENIGLIIYASSVLSGLLLGVLSRFFEPENIKNVFITKTTKKVDFLDSISKSVHGAVNSMLNVCVWVIFFSVLKSLAAVLIVSEKVYAFFIMISEVSNGVCYAAENTDVPVLCSIIGFAGLCIHLQVMPAVIKLKLKYRFYLVSRIIAAAFNCIICYVLIDLFPQSINVANVAEKVESVTVNSSVPMCICLMFLCGLFILKDYFCVLKKVEIFNRKKINKKQLY